MITYPATEAVLQTRLLPAQERQNGDPGHFIFRRPRAVHNSSVRNILSAKARFQGEKHSKVGHFARLFNAADVFSGTTPPVNRIVGTP